MEQRLTVKQAARALNVTEQAVRARIRRRTLRNERDEDGNVFVLLDSESYKDASSHAPEDEPGTQRELINTLQEQLHLEREASAELRRLLAAALQRVPAIEESSADTPAEPRGSPLSANDGTGRGEDRANSPAPEQRSSWWRRLFV